MGGGGGGVVPKSKCGNILHIFSRRLSCHEGCQRGDLRHGILHDDWWIATSKSRDMEGEGSTDDYPCIRSVAPNNISKFALNIR